MNKKGIDLIFGKKNENENLPIIKRFFGFDDLEIDLNNPFSTIDFVNDFILIELKSRRIEHDKYDTCFIGYNKFKHFKKNNDKECYIVYKYTDGLYHIKFDYELFKTFNTQVQNTWRDGICEKSKVVLIPIKHLIKMEI